jgi:hypothetical protein
VRISNISLEIGVIIPILNERDNIRVLLRKFGEALANMAWKAIFVDDGSIAIKTKTTNPITSWGHAREAAAYENMLNNFAGDGRIVAVVSDSYDLDAAVTDIWGGSLKAKVLTRQGTLVVRPDNGDPVEPPIRTVKMLCYYFPARAYKLDFLLNLKLVRTRRLELPRDFSHNDLNVARLPIPPRPHTR